MVCSREEDSNTGVGLQSPVPDTLVLTDISKEKTDNCACSRVVFCLTVGHDQCLLNDSLHPCGASLSRVVCFGVLPDVHATRP